MLGTEWAKGKKPTFTAAPAPAPPAPTPTLSVSEPAKPEAQSTGIALYKQLLAISEARVAELEAKLAHIHASSA